MLGRNWGGMRGEKHYNMIGIKLSLNMRNCMKNYRLLVVSGITGFLVLAIIAKVLFNLMPNFLYGFHSLFGYDLIGLYGRVNAYYYRNIPIECNACGYIETYPPGFHAFMASVKFITNFNTFQLDIFFRIIHATILLLLVFLIANKVGKNYVIFTLFIFSFPLLVTVSTTGYTSLSTYLQASTTSLSDIFTLVAIFTLICLFSHDEKCEKDIPYYLIFFLTFTAHGVSHVGGMVMEVSLIGSIILFLILHHIIFGGRKHFLIKSLDLISLMLLSFVFQYLIHWWKIFDFLSIRGVLSEEVEAYFGLELPQSILSSPMFLILALIIISFTVFKARKCSGHVYKSKILLDVGNILRRYHNIMICTAYIAMYVCAIAESDILVKEVLGKGTSFPFTIYFGSPHTLPTVLSKIFGLFSYILSFLGVVFFIRQNKIQAKLISWIYLCAYFTSFLALLFMLAHPSRVIYCLRLLYPFAVSGGILYMWESANKLTFIQRTKKGTYAAVLCMAIILSFALAYTVTIINKEPSIIERNFPDSLYSLKFGAVNPPVASYELIQFINTNINQNSHILASPSTQKILSSATHISPVSTGYSNFDEQFRIYVHTKQAMGLDGPEFDKYIRKYNVTHAVLLSWEHLNPEATSVSKIYETARGERVFWISTESDITRL